MTAPRNSAAVARARARAAMRSQQEAPTVPDFSPAVGSDVDPFAGEVMPSLDWEGVLHDLNDVRARDFDEMLRVHGKARQAEAGLTLPLRMAKWELTAGEGEKHGEAEEIEKMLRLPANNGGMMTPIDLVLGQLSSGSIFRRAYFEKELKPTPDGKRIMYRGLWFRPATTCKPKFTPPGKGRSEFDGFRQEKFGQWNVDDDRPDGWEDIKASRALMYVHGTHRQPVHGVSDLDIFLWSYKLSVKLQALWFDYLGSQALPRTLVWHSDPTIGGKVVRRLAQLRNSGVAYAGGGKAAGDAAVDVMDTGGKGSGEYQQAMAWLEATALDSVLLGFTGMATGAAGKGAGGAFALSKSDRDGFMMSRQAVLTEQAAFVTNYVLPDLARLNWGPQATCPTFRYLPLGEEEIEPAITLLGQLATAPQLGEGMPMEFLGELVEKVAGYLNLDEQLISEAVDYAQDKAREKAAALGVQGDSPAGDVAAATGAVNALSGMVQQAGPPGGQQPAQGVAQPANAG